MEVVAWFSDKGYLDGGPTPVDREAYATTAAINDVLDLLRHVRGESDVTVLVRTLKSEKTAILYVSDTGVGISPENIPRIFEAYFTTKKGGTGLGLPTTRRIIEEHNGHITVESQPGQGTTFRVELPLA